MLHPTPRSQAVCTTCARLQDTVLTIRDIPFSDGRGLVADLPVYVCTSCHNVVAIPSCSTDRIAAARAQGPHIAS